ncbi:MAG: hypothetical protein ACR2RF_03655 [Geminicoccaceae bacterium]
MTPKQRAEFSEWCRQRANDLQLLEQIDWLNPPLQVKLSGYDFGAYFLATQQAIKATQAAASARRNYLDIAERIEANAD